MWLFAIEIRYIWRVGKVNSKLQNRIPAPEMSFTRPNLSALIQEIEKLLEQDAA